MLMHVVYESIYVSGNIEDRKSVNWNRCLSIFPVVEICHPEEKASVCLQLILFENLCQQYSRLFPACSVSYLDHLSRRKEKTEASLYWLPSSTQWGLSHRLCCVMHLVADQAGTHRDFKWTKASHHKRWFDVNEDTHVNSSRHTCIQNSLQWTWAQLKQLIKRKSLDSELLLEQKGYSR